MGTRLPQEVQLELRRWTAGMVAAAAAAVCPQAILRTLATEATRMVPTAPIRPRAHRLRERRLQPHRHVARPLEAKTKTEKRAAAAGEVGVGVRAEEVEVEAARAAAVVGEVAARAADVEKVDGETVIVVSFEFFCRS